MMINTKHEAPDFHAFPQMHYWDDGSVTVNGGMSLRDYFAGQALAGFSQACGWQGGDFVRMAKHAYEAADELLKARKDRPHDSAE